METSFVCPALAQAMISEGTEQVVQVDHRTLLRKVMEALGATQPPIFTIYDCGSKGVRVSIKLDVTAAKYSVGKKMNVTIVETDPCQTRMEAERVAVTKAFKLLNDQHLIMIKDFTSRVVHEVEGQSCFGKVNSTLYSLEKILEQWEIVINKCNTISIELSGKENQVHGVEEAQATEIYADLNQFMSMTLDMFKGHVQEARSRATEIETERKKYHARSTEKYHANLRKGYLQDVFLQAKEVLGYVLTYLGAGNAHYSNGPTDDGMIEGVVMFNMPELPDVHLCGNLTIRAKNTTSRAAEEDAAFEALKYMEKKFKLKIVDLNHEERVAAEKDQKLLVRLLEQILTVSDGVKLYWAKMVKSVATEKSAYPPDTDGFKPGHKTIKMKDAYRFCVNCLEELDKETSMRYDDCASRFNELDNMRYKIDDMKYEMNME